jgi:hypothetical protein
MLQKENGRQRMGREREHPHHPSLRQRCRVVWGASNDNERTGDGLSRGTGKRQGSDQLACSIRPGQVASHAKVPKAAAADAPKRR